MVLLLCYLDRMSKPYASAKRISEFLETNPSGDLTIITKTTGVLGLAWLSKRTEGRNVTIIVGDTNQRHFKRGANTHRHIAINFLASEKVSICSWVKPSHKHQENSEIEASIWAVIEDGTKPTKFLVGAAPLTQSGLHETITAMVTPTESEILYLQKLVSSLVTRAKDVSGVVQTGISNYARTEPNGWDAPAEKNTGPYDYLRRLRSIKNRFSKDT